jgi:uncharacterized membrane protein HdeD (DUF308 family)
VTVLALALVLAVYAVLDGIGLVTSGLGGRDRPRWWSWVAAGLAGVIAAVWPEITALVLALAAVMGVAALLIGVALLWAAWQVRTGRVVVLRIALPTGG